VTISTLTTVVVNAYRLGHHNFYGPGPDFQVNTQKPFTVVTRLHASNGELMGIEQFYVPDNQQIHVLTPSTKL